MITFLLSNSKNILIGLAGVAIIILAYNVYSSIRQDAIQDMQYQLISAELEEHKILLKFKEEELRLRETTIEELNKQLTNINLEFDLMVEGLTGEDLDDPAPEAIREYFKRLNNGK